ncbi:MAG: DUF4041 domain-containing protein [Candidatus Hydrogenedentales bacterium]|jgi:hypothetical protein
MGILSHIVKGSKEYRELEQQFQELVKRTSHILDAEESAKHVRRLLENLQREYNVSLARHKDLVATIAAMEEDEDLIECAAYKPVYSFEFSTEYKLKLDNNRALQKQKVKDKAAVRTGSSGARAEVNRLIKLVLKAFNGECDALASNVTWKNINKTLEQVGREAQVINKLVEEYGIEIDSDYINLKLNEMRLIHEFQEKKQAEMEEQRAIREQMREEEKARLEYERALEEATREQERFQKALVEAQNKLAGAHGAELDRLNETVSLLMKKLEGAKEKGLRAQSMAELTKSGHVYVISNIGSFGDKMYKIGMTRRLEPTERINELGDASVPFRFDIHAMIYSKDAPALESKLQNYFKARQVNLVNDRKEFFFATIDEIARAVRSLHGDIQFTMAADAREYWESSALRNERKTREPDTTRSIG